MELPKGQMNNVRTIPEVKCPVVEQYKRRGRSSTLNRPSPGQCGGIFYDKNITMEQLEKFWILSAVQSANGSISKAARQLGMGRETVYRKVRLYNEKK